MGSHRGSERRNVTRAAKPPCRTFGQAVTRSSHPLLFGRELRSGATTRRSEGSGPPLHPTVFVRSAAEPLPQRGEGTLAWFFFAGFSFRRRDRSIEPGARCRHIQYAPPHYR